MKYYLHLDNLILQFIIRAVPQSENDVDRRGRAEVPEDIGRNTAF
jgi:hypothetical protein